MCKDFSWYFSGETLIVRCCLNDNYDDIQEGTASLMLSNTLWTRHFENIILSFLRLSFVLRIFLHWLRANWINVIDDRPINYFVSSQQGFIISTPSTKGYRFGDLVITSKYTNEVNKLFIFWLSELILLTRTINTIIFQMTIGSLLKYDPN